MPAPTPKSDQLRALREAKFARKPVKAAPEKMAIAQKALANVINEPSPNASPNGYARNARWRESNRDVYNATQRDLMRQRRETPMAKKPAPSKPSIAPKPATSKKGGKSGKGC